ncbi:alpha/beta hydrolase fold domain-containing protein [uncultured Demequina sp.]|uniref:alpha/beta hydrolase fold domain-containing protein n=1 Tax=uncultured Demequina sp. TaxID=693499 RepID=UPI0025DC3092|nr:alpha/beta hydrolase fold domain-containing protein [uncultured Demequina sp.]
MTSPEAARARASLERETVDPHADFAAERAAWHEGMIDAPVPYPTDERALDLAGVPGLLVTPRGPRGAVQVPSGCLLHLHGGGLVAGSSVTHRPLAALLAHVTGLAVVLPDYRLLPEHGPEDALADARAAIGAAARATGLPLVAVGGDSNGAGLALAALATGASAPALYSISGALDARLRSPSVASLAGRDPLFTPEGLRDWRDRLDRAGVDLDAPALTPLALDLTRVPRALLIAGTDELWRDDSRRATGALNEAGVDVELQEFGGMWHVWPGWTDLPESVAAARAIGDFVSADAR